MMANWETPKTNYDPATVVGPGDLNRIEGNVKWLKEIAQPIVRYMTPSNDVIMSATAERSVRNSTYRMVKQFRVRYAGIYRITFQLKNDYSWSTSAGVLVSSSVDSKSTLETSRDYITKTLEIQAIAGDTIDVNLRGDYHQEGSSASITTTGYIRNVYVRGTLGYVTAIPGNAVLQN